MSPFFRRHRGDLPSAKGLVVLFLFTMALPALLLLVVSLHLADREDLFFEEQISEVLDRLAEGFQTELRNATSQSIGPFLNQDWRSVLDSPAEMAALAEWELAEAYLLGLDGTLLFPLFPPSPFAESARELESPPAGWQRALIEARSFAEGGDTAVALEGLEALRRHPLQARQRAEVLLEEANLLAGEGRGQEAWDRLEQIVRQYPDIVSAAEIPLALVALDAQIELIPENRSEAILRLARALSLGSYFPARNTETFFWNQLDPYREELSEENRAKLEAWRQRRQHEWLRKEELRGEIDPLTSLVPRLNDHFLRIHTASPVRSESPEIELIHRLELESVPALAVWVLRPEILKRAVDRALQEPLRFNASAYLEVRTPSGAAWATGGPVAPVARSLPLETPWNGWTLQLGLEHASQLKEQAIRQREEAATMVGLAAFVLLLGTFLVFRGVRRQIQVTRAKSDFVSAISHELRTPVANIRLYGEMLELDVPTSEEERKDAYRTITSETQRLSRLIEGVLNYSRIQQGKKVFHVEEEDLLPLVQEVVDRTENMLEEEFEFRIEITGEPMPVPVDSDAFSQALENLLTNAVKYSRERKQALIEIDYTPAKQVLVGVQDFGIGIARKNRKKVFERFHRVEDEMTRKTSGTGLGLALARDLVRGFGGDIKLRSRLGEGSRFTIVLPRSGRAKAR
jgi:signal transduction histidine kinase